MSSIACDSAEALFSPAIDDELDSESARGLRIHLDACAACAASFRRLRAALADLRELSLEDAAAVPMRVLPGSPTKPRRSWRPRFSSAAAALLLIAIGGAAGAWYARASSPPAEALLAERGLSYGAGGWLPEVERLHRDRGEVWLNGRWQDRAGATATLLKERDYERIGDSWLPHAARDTLAHGFVLGPDGWSSTDAVIAANLGHAGLEHVGHSWVSAEDRAGLRLDGRLVDAEQLVAKQLSSAGYEHDAAGHWRLGDDLRHELAGEVRLGGAWRNEDEALTALMNARGYAQVAGRWTDPSHPPETPKPAPEPRVAVAERSPWEPVLHLPGVPEQAANAQAANAQIQDQQSMAASRLTPANTPVRPLPAGSGMTGWRVKINDHAAPQALGTPAVLFGKVHVGGGISSSNAYVFDAGTGKMRWQTHMSDNGPSSPVGYGDDVVYTTESCSVYAVSARNGDPDFGRFLAGSVYCMPAVSDRTLLCSLPGPFLITVEQTRSARRWAASLPSEMRTAPLVLDGRVIGATRSGTLVCWSIADGTEQWRLAAGVLAPPTRLGKDVLIRRAFHLRNDDPTYAEGLAVVDAATGSYIQPLLGEPRPLVVASTSDDKPLPLPAGNGAQLPDLGPAAANAAYAVSVRGDALDCVDLTSARLLWSAPLGRPRDFAASPLGTYQHADPCIAGDVAVVGALDGTLAAYELATGKRRWSVQLGPIGCIPAGPGGMCRVQPVVAVGKVFTTTLDGDLVCVDTGDPTLEGPHWWGQQFQSK